ncbi:MAG: M61 family metallopeptidase [Acidobacteriota bacterium]|nr:M61 family metallopeptidase [Acidobacteriota bacterium]
MTRSRLCTLAGLAVLWLAAVPAAVAQTHGPISLTVDARQAPMKIVKTHEAIPVSPGPLTLYYPKWIPGEHAPDGPIDNLTGLEFSADGKTIPWKRDQLDVFTFHLTVPAGVSTLDADFDYIEPNGGGAYTAASSATDKLIVVSWNQNLLYPKGFTSNQLTYDAKLVLPDGWKFGTALPVASQAGQAITFKPIDLTLLVDSPVIAGEYYRAVNITPPGEPIHHELDMVADSEAALNISPAAIRGMTNLVAESGKLFGSRHYRDYHFLLTLSDHVAHFGLEHHESDDSRLPERALLGPDAESELGSLLAHEFVHSWNGKFRRPADLATPEYETPMQTDLLWVYEGLTDYLGPLLAARSGLWTPQEYRQHLADISAQLGPGRPGRTWRPLLDTAVGEPGLGRARGWFNWRRGTDYYDEGDLVWLEVATIIHDVTHGQKSIDDFCHLFHGGPNNGPELKTYTFDQLVAALNQVAPYDWAHFFHERLDSTSPEAPMGGIENGGWKVVWTGSPSGEPHRRVRERGGDEYTVGLQLSPEGFVEDSIVNGPAYKAGITSGMKVVAVNSRAYTHDVLEDAIKAARGTTDPIRLLVENNDYFTTCNVDYHGGERYPSLERIPGKPDYLDELIMPRAGGQ